MSSSLISTKGQIVLPVAIRKALGLKPGMRVEVLMDGKGARIVPAPSRNGVKLTEIQALFRKPRRTVATEDLRVTDYQD